MINPQLTKTGMFYTDTFIEKEQLFNSSDGWSYVPTIDASNSCAASITVDFSNFINLNTPIKFDIELDFSWGDFTGSPSNTAGTFNVRFQGPNKKIETNAYAWEGTNYVNTVLNNSASTKTLITNNITGGSYHYATSFTIPATWFDTYCASRLSFRTDYRKGTGAITIENVKITLHNSQEATFHNNYIMANQIYEY